MPLDVPAHGSAIVSFTLTVHDRGDTFGHTVPFYVDDGGLREISLSVGGEVARPSPRN